MNPINLLAVFYRDEHTREEVKSFMLANLEEMAIQAVFEKKPVEGIAEAKELVDKTFNRLAELYAEPKKIVIESSR